MSGDPSTASVAPFTSLVAKCSRVTNHLPDKFTTAGPWSKARCVSAVVKNYVLTSSRSPLAPTIGSMNWR